MQAKAELESKAAEDSDTGVARAGQQTVPPVSGAESAAAAAKPIDYSRWDELAARADGPVYKEDFDEIEKIKEEARDREFEANNPEFVRNFMQDQEKRAASRKKRETDAESLRQQGNTAFREGRLDHAFGCYLESIRLVPFASSVLTNLAQLKMKTGEHMRATEFAQRAIFIDPTNPKALFRRGAARKAMRDVHGWARDLDRAADRAPTDLALRAQAERALEASAEVRRAEVLDALVLGPPAAAQGVDESSAELRGASKPSELGGLSAYTLALLRRASASMHALPGFVPGSGNNQPGGVSSSAPPVVPSQPGQGSAAPGAHAHAHLREIALCIAQASSSSSSSSAESGAASATSSPGPGAGAGPGPGSSPSSLPSTSTEPESPTVLLRALLLRTGALAFVARGVVRLLESSAG